VFHIEAVDRGLLIGQDRDRVNFIRTGLHAFLDFGGTTPPYVPPVGQTLDCTTSVDGNGNVSVSWNDLDGVNSWVVRRNNKWVATQTNTGFSDTPGVGTHQYVIRYKVGGVRTDGTCSPSVTITDPEPPPAGDCTATLNGTSVTLEWADAANVDSWQVRRDGKWKATTNSLTYTDSNLAAGDYSYVIRSRRGGVRVDTPCSPDPVTVGNGPGPATCAATAAGGDVTIAWNSVPGVSTYQVRRNGSWLATSNQTTYVDANAPAGAAYAVRYRLAGERVTIDCD